MAIWRPFASGLLMAVLLTSGTMGQDPCTPVVPQNTSVFSDNGITNPLLLNTLVAAVDEAQVYPDSKTIVDTVLTMPPDEIYAAYQELGLPDPLTEVEVFQTNATINETLQSFINEYLLPPGSDLANVSGIIPPNPPEWFMEIQNKNYSTWADSLYEDWNMLTRQVAANVSETPELYTMLYVPNPFVVPGARFREVYYWDTYFVMQGLLASNLTDLAESILGNFAYLIQKYGHIPNGIRTYYLNRSQPPLFSNMVRIVFEATNDTALLERMLPALLAEHEYWTAPPKQVEVMAADGSVHNLTRYYANWDTPRPESFREDQNTAREAGFDPVNPTPELEQLYRDLASGAESGWDYSTRWFAENSTDITTVRTTRVIPADLNAFLYQMEMNIAWFAGELGCTDVADQMMAAAEARKQAMNALAWNDETGQWYDLIIPQDEGDGLDGPVMVDQHMAVYPSNWFPLAAGIAEPGSAMAVAAVDSFNASGLLQVGGVPASLVESGQQWDYPNIAETYVEQAYQTWAETGANFEKFNATTIGMPGGGGEYQVVTGFGWTNGVALHLIQQYGL